MPEFDSGGQLAKLVLCNRGHDCKAKLRILIEGIDVIVLEEYADTHIQKLSCVLQRVESVTGESGDLLGDDEVEHSFFCICNHFVEMFSFLRGDTRKSFVNVAGHVSPFFIFLYEFFVIRYLVIERVYLFICIRGYAGIKCYSQRNIVYRFCSQ